MYSFIYSLVHLLIINRETGLINECPRPSFFDLSFYTLLPQRLVYARSTKQRGVFFKVVSSATASVTFTKATNSSDHVCRHRIWLLEKSYQDEICAFDMIN